MFTEMPNLVFTQNVLQDLFKEGDDRWFVSSVRDESSRWFSSDVWVANRVFNKFSSAYLKAPAVQDFYQIVVDFQLFAKFALSITQQAVKLV